MSAQKKKRVGEYVVCRKLGSGSFANVYKAYHQRTQAVVAIKAINRQKLNPKLQKNLESEISIMQTHQHESIVRLFSITKTERHIYLVLEYCAGGDLHQFIKKHRTLPGRTARFFMRQLASGIHFLWKHHLIHRDLKPQNLLLSADSDQASLKIADFGFARHLAMASMAETLCGSPLYMAPEILRLRKYDAKADLWSVGTILWEMLTGRPPFGGANQVQLLENIEKQRLRFPPGIAVQQSTLQLLQGLLQRKPQLRISFEDFFSHAYFADGSGAARFNTAGSAAGLGRGADAQAASATSVGRDEARGRQGAAGMSTSTGSACHLNTSGAADSGAPGLGLGAAGQQSSSGGSAGSMIVSSSGSGGSGGNRSSQAHVVSHSSVPGAAGPVTGPGTATMIVADVRQRRSHRHDGGMYTDRRPSITSSRPMTAPQPRRGGGVGGPYSQQQQEQQQQQRCGAGGGRFSPSQTDSDEYVLVGTSGHPRSRGGGVGSRQPPVWSEEVGSESQIPGWMPGTVALRSSRGAHRQRSPYPQGHGHGHGTGGDVACGVVPAPGPQAHMHNAMTHAPHGPEAYGTPPYQQQQQQQQQHLGNALPQQQQHAGMVPWQQQHQYHLHAMTRRTSAPGSAPPHPHAHTRSESQQFVQQHHAPKAQAEARRPSGQWPQAQQHPQQQGITRFPPLQHQQQHHQPQQPSHHHHHQPNPGGSDSSGHGGLSSGGSSVGAGGDVFAMSMEVAPPGSSSPVAPMAPPAPAPVPAPAAPAQNQSAEMKTSNDSGNGKSSSLAATCRRASVTAALGDDFVRRAQVLAEGDASDAECAHAKAQLAVVALTWSPSTPAAAETAALALFLHALRDIESIVTAGATATVSASDGGKGEKKELRPLLLTQFRALVARAQGCAARLGMHAGGGVALGLDSGTRRTRLSPPAAVLLWQAALSKGCVAAAQELLIVKKDPRTSSQPRPGAGAASGCDDMDQTLNGRRHERKALEAYTESMQLIESLRLLDATTTTTDGVQDSSSLAAPSSAEKEKGAAAGAAAAAMKLKLTSADSKSVATVRRVIQQRRRAAAKYEYHY